MTTLQQEIDKHRKEIHTDSYPMSIGELVNLYRDGELDLHPEFQRFYRWTAQQKSRWIESILLGIPLPSIFVVQRKDGVWDVIDGLQRLSAILEVMGELTGEDGQVRPCIELEGTKYLPSLSKKRWRDDSEERRLTIDQQRYIKRAKLDLKIIQRESSESAKYELFQRLNTGGSPLSDQEVRSCILISVKPQFYRWVHELSKYPAFQACLPLTERQRQEQYDLELAIRFLVLRTIDMVDLVGLRELGEFLTESAVALAADDTFEYEQGATAFRATFDVVSEALGDDAFRKYESQRFIGPFLISAFEVVALGLGFNQPSTLDKTEVAERVKTQVWKKASFLTSSGIRATQRLPHTLPFGREVFGK